MCGGDEPRIHSRRPERRFIARNNLQRCHHYHDIDMFLRRRLRPIAERRRFHIEGDGALQTEPDQSILLFGIGGESVETLPDGFPRTT